MDYDITATGYGVERRVRPLVPAPEPCEVCGTPVTAIDPMEIARAFAGMPPPPTRRLQVAEERVIADHVVGVTHLQLRAHTPERCQRVRAGDPEPWPEPDDDEYDDEDADDE